MSKQDSGHDSGAESDESWESEHPIFMTRVPEGENDNIDAIQNLLYDGSPVENAQNFKEQGNELYLRNDPAYWRDAVEHYTKGIDLKCEDQKLNSVLYSNRAAVHLKLGNYGRAFQDSRAAIVCDAANLKAYYRAARSRLAVKKYDECLEWCDRGQAIKADEKSLTQLRELAEKGLAAIEEKRRAKEQEKSLAEKKVDELYARVKERRVQLGERLYDSTALYEGNVGFDESNDQLFWPVLFLYEEYHSSDFIQRFYEHATIGDQLAHMFSDVPPDWDTGAHYVTRNLPKFEVYFETNAAEVRSGFERDDRPSTRARRLVRVKHTTTLGEALQHREHIVPGIPVFHVMRFGTLVRNDFLKRFHDRT